MLTERPRETGAGKELHGFPVVIGSRAADHLFKVDGELIGVEGTSFTDLLAESGNFVPGFKGHVPPFGSSRDCQQHGVEETFLLGTLGVERGQRVGEAQEVGAPVLFGADQLAKRVGLATCL